MDSLIWSTTEGNRKVDEELTTLRQKARMNNIKMFPRTESHYVRSNSKREYLEEGLNLTRMHLFYVQWANENKKDVASKHHYSDIKGCGSALLGEYKERSDRRVSGAPAHPIYIGMAF